MKIMPDSCGFQFPSAHPRMQCTLNGLDTEVVVMGNGPAGLSLSTFLSGWRPFYNPARPHPDQNIHDHLMANVEDSIVNQDLSWFEEEGVSERVNPSVGAFAGLYDTLVRPTGDERPKSCLRWKLKAESRVPHIVLGDGPIGGSWNTYDDEMVTVSLANWMDLPGYSLANWTSGKSPPSRLPAGEMREYLRAYAKRMRTKRNFHAFTKVTSIRKTRSEEGSKCWEVRGVNEQDRPFMVRCRKVVLACGRGHSKTLEVPGEEEEPRIVYDVSAMKQMLASQSSLSMESMQSITEEPQQQQQQVIIVGDGISAADALIHCLASDIPVLHLIRRNEKQLRNVMLSRLSASVYPEYAHVYKLMTGRETHPNYHCLTASQVVSFNSENTGLCLIETPHGLCEESYRCIVVCIGRQSDLPMLESKHEFMSNYQSASDDSLFAVGSLAGDHFVRYLIGGCMQVAQSIIGDYEKTPICHRSRQEDAVQLQHVLSSFDCQPNIAVFQRFNGKENAILSRVKTAPTRLESNENVSAVDGESNENRIVPCREANGELIQVAGCFIPRISRQVLRDLRFKFYKRYMLS